MPRRQCAAQCQGFKQTRECCHQPIHGAEVAQPGPLWTRRPEIARKIVTPPHPHPRGRFPSCGTKMRRVPTPRNSTLTDTRRRISTNSSGLRSGLVDMPLRSASCICVDGAMSSFSGTTGQAVISDVLIHETSRFWNAAQIGLLMPPRRKTKPTVRSAR